MNYSKHSIENKLFWINKRMFDIFVCLLLLPVLLTISIILLFFNYFSIQEVYFLFRIVWVRIVMFLVQLSFAL